MDPTLKYSLIGGGLVVVVCVFIYMNYMSKETFTLTDTRACVSQYPGPLQYMNRPYPFYPKNSYFKPLNNDSFEQVSFEDETTKELYTQYQ